MGQEKIKREELEQKVKEAWQNWKQNTPTIEKNIKQKNYDCQICKDRGFYFPEGKDIAMECKCVKNKRVDNRLLSARIPERFKSARLDNFEIRCSSHKEAYQHAVVLVEKIDEFAANNWGLYLQGPPSQGKTRLQASIVNELSVDKDYSGIMVNVRELLSELKDAVGEGNLNQTLNSIQQNQIIALNDLTGGQFARDGFTEFERGIIYRIMDAIYEENKVIVITAKYNYEWLEDKLGQDVRDRIQEMCGEVVVMKGYNWRKDTSKKRDRIIKRLINNQKIIY